MEIEGYEDLTEVGRGGFAVVFRATQPVLGRLVAIKVLTSPGLTDQDMRHFRREALAMGQLSWHPNIVVVYDTGVTETGYPFLVMEYLEGGSLGDQVRRQGALDAVAVMDHGVRLAGALHTAHEAGLLHRDVKPDNVLVDVMGRAKLADFGIAAIADQTLTASGMVTATIAHAAPEVLNGQRATAASDVYSLGSTLYELVAGKAAFVRDGEESIVPLVMRVTHDPVLDLGSTGVPAALATAIEAAMAKNPSDRPYSALVLGEALQAAQQATGTTVTEVPVRHSTPEPPGTAVPAAGHDTAAEVEGRVTEVDPVGAGLARGDRTVREPDPRPGHTSGLPPPSPDSLVSLPDHSSAPTRLLARPVVLAAVVIAGIALGVMGVWLAQRDNAQPDETTAASSTTIPTPPSTTTATPQTTAADGPLSAGGLTEGTPEGLPEDFETLRFPMPTPSTATDIDDDLVTLEFPPATPDDYDLEEFMRTVPPQRGWTLDREDPAPGSTFGPTLHYSNPNGSRIQVTWGDVGPGPGDGTRIESMTISAEHSLQLAGDGLGAVDFGDSGAEALATLSETFGPPASDETYQPGGCPAPVTRTVTWPDSAIVIYIADDGSFVGYHFSGAGSSDYPLETQDGVALGDTLNDLTEIYGPALSLTGQNFFAIDDGTGGTLEGFLTGEDPDDTVDGFMAGDDCLFD